MAHEKEDCFEDALRAWEKATGNNLGADFKLPWRQNLDGSWRPEDRGFWAGVRSMLKLLNGRGHEDSVRQIRNPDMTIDRKTVVDLKFTRQDGTVDNWGTKAGAGNQRTQEEDYEEINQQSDPNAKAIKLDPETCQCGKRGAEPVRVPQPVPGVAPYFMPMPGRVPLPARMPVPVPSSVDYKDQIEPARLDAERLLQLKPVRFRWKASGEADLGYLAEDVRALIPELWQECAGIKGYRLGQLPFYLVELLKAQQQQIDALRQELRALQQTLASATDPWPDPDHPDDPGSADPARSELF